MAGSNQLAAGTVSFAELITRAKARIAAALSVDASSIRVVAVPDDELPEYLSAPGTLVRVRSADPVSSSGGGRHDYRVSRIVDVFVLTENLSDPGGRDDVAVALHVAAEEAVADALHDQPPPLAVNNNAIPVTVKWVPGGAEIVRRLSGRDADPGLLTSCLSFRFDYRAPLTVFRE